MKKILKRCISLLPTIIQRYIYKISFAVKHPNLVTALNDYKYTDEHLKFVHILECINYVRVAGSGGVISPVYFEFGCHSGRTFSAAVNAARFLNMENAEFYAFDSFQGLPSTDSTNDGIFQSGTFCTARAEFISIVDRQSGLRLDDTHVIEGFYCDSLTNELQARMPKAGVVHIDVDLYSSTVEVLRFVKPLLMVGTVLIFDDWYCFPPGTNKGEMRALSEFCEANPSFKLQEWKVYSTFGKSFFVTALP
jgi:O-methyltransferase